MNTFDCLLLLGLLVMMGILTGRMAAQTVARRPGRLLPAGLFAVASALLCLALLQRSGDAPAVQGTAFQVTAPWSWPMQTTVAKSVRSSFPGAKSGPAVMSKVLGALSSYRVKPSNTILGLSICSDEINNDKGHLSSLMSRYFWGGRPFFMGGIGGAPFVGKTGFGAFSHHVPDSGNVIVLFAPHIGFTSDSEAGKFFRTGQAQESTACGAVVAAYNQCKSGPMMGADVSDLQQSWLRKKLAPHCSDVKKSSEPMVALAMKAYKVVEEEVLSIVNTGFGSGHLILIGGIQINMPYPMQGFFVPLHFSIRTANMPPRDLMNVFA